MSARTLFRATAIAEAITWTLLLIGLFLKYVTRTTELGVRIGGGVHGFVFLCFAVCTCFTWINQKWSAKTGLLALVSAVLPYASIPVEKSLDRRGLLAGPWRLADGGEQPNSFPEKVQAGVLRRPVLSAAVAVVAVAAIFAFLVFLGPPGTWFGGGTAS